jgi:transposase, IS6 family
VVPPVRALLSDVEELLAERGIAVDHVTVYRWVQRCTPLLIDAARPCRHVLGDRWCADETSRSPGGGSICTVRSISMAWSSMYWCRRSGTWRPLVGSLFGRWITVAAPSVVTTDQASAYPRVLDELVPAACHLAEQYGNNRIEADHG